MFTLEVLTTPEERRTTRALRITQLALTTERDHTSAVHRTTQRPDSTDPRLAPISRERPHSLVADTLITFLPLEMVLTLGIASNHSRPPELHPPMELTSVTVITATTPATMGDPVPPTLQLTAEPQGPLSVVALDTIRLSNPSRRLDLGQKTTKDRRLDLLGSVLMELESRVGLPTHRPMEDRA